MKILGIEIERKTDILAFAAFMISISNLMLQGFNLIKGPKLILDPPKQVVILPCKYHDNKKYIRISARMTYFNQGSPGHHDVIKLEEAYINFPVQKETIKTIKLNAQKYIHSKEDGESRTDEDDKSCTIYDGLSIDIKSDAMPFQIESRNVKSNETLFVPRPINISNEFELDVNKNFLEYSEFLNLLDQNQKINIRFISRNLKNREKKVICNLKTKDFLKNLKEKNWAAPVCTNN